MVVRGLLADSDLLTLLSPDQVAIEMAAGLLTGLPLPGGRGVRTIGISTRVNWRPTAAQSAFLACLIDAAAITRIR